MEENKNKNKKKPRYDYNDYTDSSGYKYNKISILEAIVQSYRVITDEGDDNSLSNKDRGNNNMEIFVSKLIILIIRLIILKLFFKGFMTM